jgi:iron complex outermembrane receptor protein
VFGVSPVNGFGGTYVSFNFSSIRGTADYDYRLIPHSVASLYGTYTTDEKSWGKAGFTVGATHVSSTSTLLNNPITYPAYWVSNLSAFYEKGPYQVTVNVDNLFDKLYFTPDADSYANLGALPSIGREWRVTLKRSF